jgi:hypothetical protein
VLGQPLAYNFNVEYRTFCGADWVFEGLKAGGAKVEREPLEVRSIGRFL